MVSNRDTQRWALRSELLFTKLGPESVILDPNKGLYYSVSGVAESIVEFMIQPEHRSEGCERGTIQEHIEALYGVSDEQVEQDIEAFLNELQSQNLVVPTGHGK